MADDRWPAHQRDRRENDAQDRHELAKRHQYVDRKIERLDVTTEHHAKAIKELEDVVDKVRDRVAPWVVWAMTGMGAIIGALATLAAR